MNKLLKYKLIGIGDFTHGIEESWLYRFKLIKFIIKNTNKNINIFNEMSIWQASNVMNNTIWSREKNKFIRYDKIKKEDPIQNGDYVGGELWQYIPHCFESNIILKIIKYIRKNKERITLYGIDNDTIDRDYDMYKIIINNMDDNKINLLFASNNHISTNKLHKDNYLYIKNKNHKWYCGYYLRKKLKKDYCIILSQAYEGYVRFNGYCIGNNCESRINQLKYIYKKYKYIKLKKYVKENKKYQLLDKFTDKFLNFSNSYYKKNKYGYQSIDVINDQNYILFWNNVNHLI